MRWMGEPVCSGFEAHRVGQRLRTVGEEERVVCAARATSL